MSFEQITFKQFASNTGSLLLTIELQWKENMNNYYFDDIERLNRSSVEIGLSPISHFESI